METTNPKLELARKILPRPLLAMIEYIFDQKIGSGCCLVGGTALAGFYAGHRKSDDIDLFVNSAFTFKAVTLAIQSATQKYPDLKTHRSNISNQYFNGQYELDQHFFTIDIVIDENLHQNFKSKLVGENLWVAELNTIYAMKIATIVSRCSEKDLYDLQWLFNNPDLPQNWEDRINLAAQIDSGVNVENMLISLLGTHLDEFSCNFSYNNSIATNDIFNQIVNFKNKIEKELIDYAKLHPFFEENSILDKLIKNLNK